MGILDSIFGSSSSVQSAPIRLQSSLTPQQQGVQSTLGGTFAGGPANVFPGFTGQLTAPEQPLQTMSLTGLESLFGGATASPGTPQGTAQSTLQQVLTSQPQDLQSYYQTNVLNPLKTTFENTTLPDIMSASGSSVGGYQSTSQGNAIRDATNNFMNTLAATQGQLTYDTAQQNIANKLNALQLAPGVTGMPFTQLGQLLAAGGTQQQIAQQPLTAALALWAQQQGFSQNAIQDMINYMNVAALTPANQNFVTQSSPGLLGGILQSIGGQGGLLSSIFGGGGGAAAGAAGAGVGGAGDIGATAATLGAGMGGDMSTGLSFLLPLLAA